MTVTELTKAFDTYAESIKAPYRIERILKKGEGGTSIKCTGGACIFCKAEEEVHSCQVISLMTKSHAFDGLAVYSILLHLFTQCGQIGLNKWLDRLGHYDHSIDLNGRRTMADNYELSVRPNNPVSGTISWFIQKQ